MHWPIGCMGGVGFILSANDFAPLLMANIPINVLILPTNKSTTSFNSLVKALSIGAIDLIGWVTKITE